MPKVSIIIINFNGWPDTKECLASLEKIAYDNFEVILIDNASKEKPEIPNSNDQKFKIHTIFNEENLGFAGGNNQGIKLALEGGADYILLLNNDTVVEPDFLSALVEAAQADERCAIAGPLIYFFDERDLIWSAGGRLSRFFTRGELVGYREKDEGQYHFTEQVDYISGTCLLIKTEFIKKIGLISEDYFLYYEDTDWCQRAKIVGGRCLLVPGAKIYHKASRSTKEFSYPYIYYHSRNGLMFAARFGRKWQVYLLSIWLFAKQAAKLATSRKKRKWAKPVMQGILDFWWGKRGKLEGYY